MEQDIERGDYLTRRNALMSEKRSLQEQSLLLERDVAHWLEPMREWINEAQALGEIAQSQNYPPKNPPSKKSSARTSPSTRAKRADPAESMAFARTGKNGFPENGFNVYCGDPTRNRTALPSLRRMCPNR